MPLDRVVIGEDPPFEVDGLLQKIRAQLLRLGLDEQALAAPLGHPSLMLWRRGLAWRWPARVPARDWEIICRVLRWHGPEDWERQPQVPREGPTQSRLRRRIAEIERIARAASDSLDPRERIGQNVDVASGDGEASK